MTSANRTRPEARTINSVSEAIDALNDDVMDDLKPKASPKPISLLEIDAGLSEGKILKWFRIPKTKRSEVRKTLAQIGVTDASLFPELDYQSKYLVSRWTYKQP